MTRSEIEAWTRARVADRFAETGERPRSVMIGESMFREAYNQPYPQPLDPREFLDATELEFVVVDIAPAYVAIGREVGDTFAHNCDGLTHAFHFFDSSDEMLAWLRASRVRP